MTTFTKNLKICGAFLVINFQKITDEQWQVAISCFIFKNIAFKFLSADFFENFPLKNHYVYSIIIKVNLVIIDILHTGVFEQKVL